MHAYEPATRCRLLAKDAWVLMVVANLQQMYKSSRLFMHRSGLRGAVLLEPRLLLRLEALALLLLLPRLLLRGLPRLLLRSSPRLRMGDRTG